ncbi:hypothetical protein C8R43DRAFT_1135603 [Mycena crocata]|nr:hypothetical protein C8R43DRAFT_1135603 [Mycena crocata]
MSNLPHTQFCRPPDLPQKVKIGGLRVCSERNVMTNGGRRQLGDDWLSIRVTIPTAVSQSDTLLRRALRPPPHTDGDPKTSSTFEPSLSSFLCAPAAAYLREWTILVILSDPHSTLKSPAPTVQRNTSHIDRQGTMLRTSSPGSTSPDAFLARMQGLYGSGLYSDATAACYDATLPSIHSTVPLLLNAPCGLLETPSRGGRLLLFQCRALPQPTQLPDAFSANLHVISCWMIAPAAPQRSRLHSRYLN